MYLVGKFQLPFCGITMYCPHLPFWGQKLGERSTMVMGANKALMRSWAMWAFKEMPRRLVPQQTVYWQADANIAAMTGAWVEHSWSTCKHPWVKRAGCRRVPKLSLLFSRRCCHRHDCCYDKAEKEGCNPKVQRYQWECEQNAVRCGKETLARVGFVLLPPPLARLTEEFCGSQR